MESLLSVGIDIGTTTTQLVFSRLTLENENNAFSVPHVVIRDREVIYRSEVHFTPLRTAVAIDGEGVRRIVSEEYRRAGISPEEVDTGAVIITGETARKENAREVLRELSAFAGSFVVSTAGPDLESILAARGAGAQRASKEREGLLMHMDIGGGTSNLAVYENGKLISVGCLDVGGRVIRLDEEGRIDWMTPKIQALFPNLKLGQRATEDLLRPVVELLVEALEAAAGLREGTERTKALVTHKLPRWQGKLRWVSFSGGVADAVWKERADWSAYGDIGILLGRAIRSSRLFAELEPLQLGETIRATVIGAGTQTTELSGSTVFYRGINFPLQDLPVLRLEMEELTEEQLSRKSEWLRDEEGPALFALALPGLDSPGFRQVQEFGELLARWYSTQPTLFPVIALERDMAKALGQALGSCYDGPILCLDGISAGEGDYLDVGEPVAEGMALPVIVKTLAFH